MVQLEKELQNISGYGDWVGLKSVTEKTSWRTVRDEKPHRSHTEVDTGIMVEVLIDGHFGYAGTSDTSSEGIRRAAQKAQNLARSASRYKVHSFSTQERPANKGEYQSPRSQALDQLSLTSLYDVLISSTKAMNQSDKIVSRKATAMIIETETGYVSSSGAQIFQNFNIVSSSLEATAQDGNIVQSRSESGGLAKCYQVGSEFFHKDQFLMASHKIASEACELLRAENTPSEIMDLILAPDQMTLQIHESIGHPLEYDRILGDERNYAGWSFVKPEDFGKLKYGSPIMNVTFDPTVQHEMASYAFDETGAVATKEFLIRNGVLERGLGSLESQKRLQLPGVANFRSSSWNRAPIDRMANINLEPGTSTLEELIAQTERGVLMLANRSWSIDDYRNKFQFGCEYAKLIENGRLTKTLKNPNYRGTTIDFWSKLKGLSKNTEMYGSPFCGKGEPNQVIRVGHQSPYALFSNIEVFGA